tara:strand:- start:1762 stop:2700 length:939 start_codon:yes stop_codon:yes gene_type:complete
MKNKKINLSVIIPVFNEEQHIDELTSRLISSCRKLKINFEIIYVDDGSNDKSLAKIIKFSSKYKFIKYISFIKNFGQHAAVIAGFEKAKGNFILTLDSDLQNPPEEISKFYSAIKLGKHDIVTGIREKRNDPILRKISSNIMNKVISSLTGLNLKDYGCMMRAYKKSVINKLLLYGEKSVYIPAYTSWLSKSILEIKIKQNPRLKSKSKYSIFKLLGQVFDLITAYSLIPIRFINFMGIIIFLSGIFLFFYLMYYRIVIGTTDQLTSFIAILLFLSGVTVFSIGIISEYIIRLYKEVRKIPQFIIDKTNLED